MDEAEAVPESEARATRWGLSIAITAFAWFLLSTVSRISPVEFPVAIRSTVDLASLPCQDSVLHLCFVSSGFSIVSPAVDQLALLISCLAVVAVLELNGRRLGAVKRALILVPVFALAALSVSQWVLLVVGAAGMLIETAYIVRRSGEVVGVSPRVFASSVVVLMTVSAGGLFLASGARWALDALDGTPPLAGPSWLPALLALRLANVLYSFLPVVVLLFFLSWLARVFLYFFWEPIEGWFAKAFPTARGGVPEGGLFSTSRAVWVLTLTGLLGALVVGSYLYAPKINSANVLVGYDVRTLYFPTLKSMVAMSPSDALHFALINPRGVFMLAQYGLAGLVGSPSLATKAVPAILAVSLAVSTYVFTVTCTGDKLLGATACAFSAFSLMVANGISAGLDADWLAMCVMLVFFSLLIAGIRRKDAMLVVGADAVSVLLLFSHPWTWLVTLGVVGAYLGFTLVQVDFVRWRSVWQELVATASILVVNFAADEARKLLGVSTGVNAVLTSTAGSALKLANVPHVMSILQATLEFYLNGALNDPLLFIMATVGVLTLPRIDSPWSKLLLAWSAVTSGGVILSGFSAYFIQARVILLVPFQVLAAMGFLSAVRFAVPRMWTNGKGDKTLANAFVLFAYLAVLGAMMGYALLNAGALYTGQ